MFLVVKTDDDTLQAYNEDTIDWIEPGKIFFKDNQEATIKERIMVCDLEQALGYLDEHRKTD